MKSQFALMMAFTLAGCGPSAELTDAATAFRDLASECMVSIRDHGHKYERSPPCQGLRQASLRYMEAGGGLPDTPVEAAYIAEQGRTQAWMAKALSSGGAFDSLW